MMAVNMFSVNEMKAMEMEKDKLIDDKDKNGFKEIKMEEENSDSSETQYVQWFLNKVLTYENTINFFGGLFLSGANNYLKWWDYNPGKYFKLVWFGWRSKRFLKDILQFEVNFNAVRGTLWLIPGIIDFIQYANGKEDLRKSTAGLITMKILSTNEELCKDDTVSFGFVVSYFFFFILQGFVSMPLTLHLPKINLSISISLDSIIWGITGMILDKKKEGYVDIDALTGESVFENNKYQNITYS